MGLDVLIYWPNIIGYVRAAIVLAAWSTFNRPAVFICLYSTFVILDGVDGWVARRLGQTSRFGAWLDVVVDNLGRGMLWSSLWKGGWLLSAVEWCVFVCNHSSRGPQWKSSFTDSPLWVRSIMANGFRTPLGLWVIGGLHGLPLWLYGCRWGVLAPSLGVPATLQAAGTVALALGRLLGLAVEMWCIWSHIRYLTKDKEE